MSHTTLSRKPIFLKELAYAGFLYDALLAVSAHVMVSDEQHYHSLVAIVLILVSWIYDRKVFGNMTQEKINH